MYNHTNQFRCIIIRGKSKRELDNLLPAYALVIDDICPCPKDEFEAKFNSAFARIMGKDEAGITKKTLDNHRTEIAGKLFGMYYLSDDGFYYAAERTNKYIADNDQPAFFKDICYKMQFPNGMNKVQTLIAHTEQNISFRQYPFIIRCLMIAESIAMPMTVNAVGYYILNALDVLKGNASPEEVMRQYELDIKKGIVRKIFVPNKASSFTMQHIREQLNYLELANLIFIDEEHRVLLNHKEDECLEAFVKQCGVPPAFNVYSYNLDNATERSQVFLDWDEYFSKVSDIADIFATNVSALIERVPKQGESKPAEGNTTEGSTVELGDEGEQYVYEYERRRVAAFNPRLVNKVIPLGRTKGLGYDIQSVIAEKGDMAEFVKYIEVKATKRVTAPNLGDDTWVDTINITRNEWVAAQQHRDYYSIYRVYFVRDGVVVFVINNIYKKEADGKVQVIPMMYRVDFSSSAIDAELERQCIE